MAILGKFEVNILLPVTQPGRVSHKEPEWEKAQEYIALDSGTYEEGDVYSKKYIAVPVENDEYSSLTDTYFAIDFKTSGPIVRPEAQRNDYIVFRVYHDDKKIGSAHVKREMWKRRLTYRVRKKGRRHWVEGRNQWVEQRWCFDQGSHGSLRIEVWWERDGVACDGAWNKPYTLPTKWNEFSEYVNLEDPTINTRPLIPRVRHARKVDDIPIAEFVFEYRSEGTDWVPPGREVILTDNRNAIQHWYCTCTRPAPTVDH